jgi:class 3 adenylate cyclase
MGLVCGRDCGFGGRHYCSGGLCRDAVEVVFCDGEGRTYATAALQPDDLVRLHHGPLEQVA